MPGCATRPSWRALHRRSPRRWGVRGFLGPSKRRDVGGIYATIDQKGAGRYERGVVRSQETRCGCYLLRFGKAAHRDVNQAPRGALRVFGEQLLQQGGVDRAGTKGIYAHSLARELNSE